MLEKGEITCDNFYTRGDVIMLKRKIESRMEQWKSDPDHKPLIIKGCRQCGKTYSVLRFAKKNYPHVVYLNFFAEKLGWEGGSLEPYAPGMCIGGSHFGNYEGLLPEKEGRTYTECDIDTLGAEKRGAKRIVFSNDGLIYYTEDHYESFELLYGEES